MNFAAPVELHDYRFLGETYREREYIKRQKGRWVARLEKMTPLKRQALLMALREFGSGSGVPGGDAGGGDGRRRAAADMGVGAESAGGDDVIMLGEVRRGPGGLEYNLPVEEAIAVDEELRACIGKLGGGVE